MNQTWLKLLKFIAFLIFVYLVIYGQATVGRKYLLIQLVGVAGLVGLLWNYNRSFK
ncbi:DUF6903 family protein [Dolosigranulum pigrum]|jgi:hypothetical protein|uniref:DUF6903 family protein n=1 Tax=Dolosigranulum pigrum TaxID=29394 RepID=UPI0015ECB203|nr:hypothetical protein [Dolosigranulum pigrum]